MRNSHDFFTGFTLLELLVTLAIVGILLTVSLPSYQDFSKKLQTRLMTERIIESLNYARLEALLLKNTITIKPINHNYQNGWEIFDQAKLIKIYPASPISITTQQLSRKNTITFQSNGMSEGSNGSFVVNQEYKITLNRGGRVYVSRVR